MLSGVSERVLISYQAVFAFLPLRLAFTAYHHVAPGFPLPNRLEAPDLLHWDKPPLITQLLCY
jgi:hypothetical protein